MDSNLKLPTDLWTWKCAKKGNILILRTHAVLDLSSLAVDSGFKQCGWQLENSSRGCHEGPGLDCVVIAGFGSDSSSTFLDTIITRWIVRYVLLFILILLFILFTIIYSIPVPVPISSYEGGSCPIASGPKLDQSHMTHLWADSEVSY